MKQEQLNDLVERFCETAQRLMRARRHLSNLVMAVPDGGAVDPTQALVIDSIPYALQPKMVRKLARRSKALALIHVAEGWEGSYDGPGTLPPSLRADRREVIVVTACTRDGLRASTIIEVKRSGRDFEFAPRPTMEDCHDRLLAFAFE